MKEKWETKAWAIINHNKLAIVNDGTGQKQIYRAKKPAKEKAECLGCGTSIVEIKITPRR